VLSPLHSSNVPATETYPCYLLSQTSQKKSVLTSMSSINNQLSTQKSHVGTTMDIKLINIGFGNIVSANRVIAIVSPESAPIKRIINDARDRGQLIDATYGRRTRAVIISDSGHVVLSAIQPETVANRFVVSKDANGDN
jgi:extracellular matrix regulatory protein A